MSFDAAWLALREPADRRARSTRLAQATGDAFPPDRTISVVDLGAGTGSNARYLTRYLPSSQTWMLVDYEESLLAAAREQCDMPVTTRVADLARLSDYPDLFTGCDLITASAWLDLVSEPWLRALLLACRKARAAALFTLSYDGRIECMPEDPEDDRIRRLVNTHQRTDKGFGPALGPAAPELCARIFGGLGYQVQRERSDWKLSDAEGDLQRRLIEGWAQAATEIAPLEAASIAAWRDRRLEHVRRGDSRLLVGHEDLAAL